MYVAAGLDDTFLEPKDGSRFLSRQCDVAWTKQLALLLTDCNSLYDWIDKEGAAPSSTDERLAIQLAIVKSRETDGEVDLRWVDARYQNCSLLDEARIEEIRGSIAASDQPGAVADHDEETMLDNRRAEGEGEAKMPESE